MGQSLCPHRIGRGQQRTDRAGFVRRAGNLRYRWQGHDRLSAHRRDPYGARANAAREIAGCPMKYLALFILAFLSVPAAAQTAVPPAPYADRQLEDPKLEAQAKSLMETIRRSEEHTSELQSLMRTSYAVFCLKKKINNKREGAHPKNL